MARLTPVEIGKQRGIVKRAIKSCVACELHDGERVPVPCSGPTPNSTGQKWGVLGDAPDNVDTRRGESFVGSSGRLLRRMITQVGLDCDDVQFMNTVCCWPTKLTGKANASRPPSESEMRACRGNLLAQLKLLTEPYVLLVGATALKSFRPDLTVSQSHGRLMKWNMTWGDYWVMPIAHPLGMHRQAGLAQQILNDLETWANDVIWSDTPDMGVASNCVVCGTRGYNQDSNLVSYCDVHWGKHGGSDIASIKYWNGPKVKYKKRDPGPGQGTML